MPRNIDLGHLKGHCRRTFKQFLQEQNKENHKSRHCHIALVETWKRWVTTQQRTMVEVSDAI